MHTTNFRNLFHLRGYQVVLVLLFVAVGQLNAQRGNFNYLDYKNKPYYFGITLGYNTSDFKLHYSDDFILNDSISTLAAINGPGFNLGMVTNYKIGEFFDLRLLPTLSFAERNLSYTDTENFFTPVSSKIESVFVELPFQVRYKSAPYKDMRLFVIGGIKYGFDVASKSRNRQINPFAKVANTDFQYEYGFGFQIFFPYFIFSPEFKVSQGVSNILEYDRTLENNTSVIDRITSRTFTISLHFEG